MNTFILLVASYALAFGLNFLFHIDVSDKLSKLFFSVPMAVYTVLIFVLFNIENIFR